MGRSVRLQLLLCSLLTGFMCHGVAFLEEPSAGGRSDGYCGRILRAQTQGTRRDGHHEFRLRVEGDPESYQPGSTYRGRSWSAERSLCVKCAQIHTFSRD